MRLRLNAQFFDAVRPVFSGKLTQGQVDGMVAICDYSSEVSVAGRAYILATTWHETGKWMQPIREGAWRYGPDPSYTDAMSRRAVASLHKRGIISRDYALPDENGNSFYGRGLTQLTLKVNYEKFEKILGIPLSTEPELAMDMQVSLDVMFIALERGLFRNGWSLQMLDGPGDMFAKFVQARNIVNADAKKNGALIAKGAMVFLKALQEGSEQVIPETRVKEKTQPVHEVAEEHKTANVLWNVLSQLFRKD